MTPQVAEPSPRFAMPLRSPREQQAKPQPPRPWSRQAEEQKGYEKKLPDKTDRVDERFAKLEEIKQKGKLQN